MTTTCDGFWGFARSVPSDGGGPEVSVQSCSGCSDRMVIIGYRGFTIDSPASDEDAVRRALDERRRAQQ